MTVPTCGTPHYDYSESLCTEPAGHYIRDRDPHAAPLIIDGRQCGGLAWDEPEPPVTDRHTVNTITSDALDQLYADLDQARQHAAAIAAQRDRLRQRMNTLADRWDAALAPDKPYARTLREQITCAPFDPEGAMTVQEYTERGRRLWVFRCWGADTCDGWLGLEHDTQTSALAERERHVAEEHPEPSPAATEAIEHHYLSTGCLHDDHAYCQGMTGLNGSKRPGECKHCGTKCICACHTGTIPAGPTAPYAQPDKPTPPST